MTASSPETPPPPPEMEAPSLLPGGPLLDHLEKTLADNYRKEIDQEENVWRSLPFFAAGLALQIAATVGVVGNLPPVQGWLLYLVAAVFGAVAIASCATLAFLGASIAPARFRYIATEPELRDYALELAQAELRRTAAEPPGMAASVDGVTAFKNELARQYGLATHHNRIITQRRARRRSLAGMCMLASVLVTLALVGVTVWAHIAQVAPAQAGERHVSGVRQEQLDAGSARHRPGPADNRSGRDPSAGDARSPEGMVGEPGTSRDGQRTGADRP